MSTSAIGRSPEAHFVALCVREPDATSPEQLATAARSIRDWQKVADLDLMVHTYDEGRAVTALLGRGYAELLDETGPARRTHPGHAHDSGTFHRLFASADGRALIELHLDPLQLGVAPLLEAERWARAEVVPGFPGALMLAPEDQVVQLSVHQQKHGFSRFDLAQGP